MSSSTPLSWFVVIPGTAVVAAGAIMAIRGKWGRSELPARSVRLGGVAFLLFGTSLCLHAVMDLVGLPPGGLRLTLSTVNLGFIPVVFGLLISAGILASRDRQQRAVAMHDALSGEPPQQVQ